MEKYKLRKMLTVTVFVLLLSVQVYAEGVSLTGYAGSGEMGYQDGARLSAKFNQPYGILPDGDGGLIVVDSYNNRIRKIKADRVETIAGFADKTDSFGLPQGGYADGDALKARFDKPRDAALDSKGNLYITDTGNNVVRVILHSDGKVYTFAGTGKAGYRDGKGSAAQFSAPAGIAVDGEDNLFVADSLNNVIRKISPKGDVTTYAGLWSSDGGYRDGDSAQAQFNEPSDIAVDKKGILYVLDSGNQRVRKIDGNVVSTVAGGTGDLIQGTNYVRGGFKDGTDALFNFPKGLDVAEDGTLFVADTWNHRIRAIKPDGEVVTIAGSGVPGRKDGLLVDATFNGPVDVLYRSGMLYISDSWNNSIRTMPVSAGNLVPVSDKNELIGSIEFLPPSDGLQVWVDGERVDFPDVKPFIANERTMLPLRFICERWGARVEWDGPKNQVEVKKDDITALFTANGQTILNRDGRIMVQVRELANRLGYSITWVPEYRAVVIFTK